MKKLSEEKDELKIVSDQYGVPTSNYFIAQQIKKIIQPAGISSGIMFLLCDESTYTTGIELIIDGGITARP